MLVLLAAMLPSGGCETEQKPAARGGGGSPPVPVLVAQVERKDVGIRLEAIGTVVPIRTVSVLARVSGEITGVGFSKGQEVKTGDLLFQIDARPYQTALEEAEAQLKRDQVLAANARVDSRRYQQLADGGFVGSREYDEARANAAALSATLALDQAAADAARLNVEYTTIRSPIDGRTGDVLVDVGNLVSPSATRPLVVINQVRPIDVSLAVPEEDLPEIRRRMADGRVAVEARPPGGAVATGALTFIDNAIDPSTGMIQLRATFPNGDGALWPGQYVDAALLLGERPGVTVVPAAAVQTGQQGRYVFVVKADKTVEMRPVEVATIDEREAVIGRGLAVGETVVTDGQFRLVPGGRVKIGAGDAGQASASPR